MADSKHEESFKVIDRRPFTSEGELRKDAVEQERREEETAAATPSPQLTAPARSPEAPR